MGGKLLLERLADVATVVVASIAVVMALAFAAGRVTNAERFGRDSPREDLQVANWEELVAGGHRIGAVDAGVTILYFGDYECPYCRIANNALRAIVDSHSGELAVVFRHLPRTSRPGAQKAARFAECGAQQGRFEAVHRLLFGSENPAGLDLTRVTLEARVPDSKEFWKCVEGNEEILRIRNDRKVAEELGIYSTPRFVLDGVLLGASPDSAGLSELVLRALAEGRN